MADAREAAWAAIPWTAFRADLVDLETLRLVKAASLVEHNAAHYGDYLHRVFADDAQFRAAIDRWVAEEERHGVMLRRWAQLADPSFDGDAALARFADAIRLPAAARSVRGSRLGELVARCTVEAGTVTFYGALGGSVAEPVLRAICRCIASDEGRHYRLFLDHARRYRNSGSRWAMLGVALGRIADTGDDELAFAWHASGGETRYRRRQASASFRNASLHRYRPAHVERAARLVAQASGLAPAGWLAGMGAQLGWRILRLQLRRAREAGARARGG